MINEARYGTRLGLAINETQLIWMRYSAFLIIEGFYVSSVLSEYIIHDNKLIIVVSLINIFTIQIWHILNYAGWVNQNIYNKNAASCLEKDKEKHEFDKFWITPEIIKPSGAIYHLAQFIPNMLFAFSLLICLINANAYFLLGYNATEISIFIIILFCTIKILTLSIEKAIYYSICEGKSIPVA